MIDMSSNLDMVGEISGTITGVSQISNNPDYVSELIEDAHAHAAAAFDEFAASYGLAGGISHMFEYGTAGVTPGPPTFSATDKEAQLWIHLLEGYGAQKEVSFTFRPALKANPKPTVASTGVSSKYLKNLSNRKYVFRQRAIVTEMGMEVNITAKNGDFLFVPFQNNPAYGKYANNRGYMMWNSSAHGPIKSTPGASTAGNFGALWAGWWGQTGGPLIEATMVENYNSDLAAALKESEVKAAAVPVTTSRRGSRAKTIRGTAIRRTMTMVMGRAKKRGRHRA